MHVAVDDRREPARGGTHPVLSPAQLDHARRCGRGHGRCRGHGSDGLVLGRAAVVPDGDRVDGGDLAGAPGVCPSGHAQRTPGDGHQLRRDARFGGRRRAASSSLGRLSDVRSLSAGYVVGGAFTALGLAVPLGGSTLGGEADLIVPDGARGGTCAAHGLPRDTQTESLPREVVAAG